LRQPSIWLHQAQGGGVGPRLRLADLRDQLDQHVLHVADDRDVDLDALGDARRVDVDVDDLALVRAKCLGLPITRSSKRAPTASSTSQFCMVMLAS
jgi:hypothetical protein